MGEVACAVVVEAGLEGEAAAHWGGEEPGAGRGTNEGEGRNAEADAAGVGALVDHDVDAKVFHGGVEVFLDVLVDAVDFVDEEDVIFFQIGEEASKIGGFFNDGA